MSHQAHIADLTEQLEQAKKAATPVTAEILESDKDKVVTQFSNGTIRTDHKGGEPVKYFERSHMAVIEPASPVVPWNKENGKLLEDNDVQRSAKLKSGTLRVDFKSSKS